MRSSTSFDDERRRQEDLGNREKRSGRDYTDTFGRSYVAGAWDRYQADRTSEGGKNSFTPNTSDSYRSRPDFSRQPYRSGGGGGSGWSEHDKQVAAKLAMAFAIFSGSSVFTLSFLHYPMFSPALLSMPLFSSTSGVESLALLAEAFAVPAIVTACTLHYLRSLVTLLVSFIGISVCLSLFAIPGLSGLNYSVPVAVAVQFLTALYGPAKWPNHASYF